MKARFPRFGTLVAIVPFLFAAGPQSSPPSQSQAKPAATAAKSDKSDTGGKNPVKATPESLAEAKKYFGYDCAMCHGAEGDGRGDLAKSMGLKMNDWKDSNRLEAMSDAELFEIIVKGRGRMVGEADRYPEDTVWELVNYVRTFEKKQGAAIPVAGRSSQ